MRQSPKILLLSCLLLGLSLGRVIPVRSQSTSGAGFRYFTETGHNVQGEFLAFFDRYGGVATFGLPRTEEFSQGGLKVQYFQRARMELHPDNPVLYRVQLSLLGDLLGYRTPAIPAASIPPMNHPERRYCPQTGHTISYSFLQYYDSHGGLDVFGYPITELLTERGTVVQYFQRAKMEWHPENPISYQVTLGNLGDEYIARVHLPSSDLDRVPPPSSGRPGVQHLPTPLPPTPVDDSQPTVPVTTSAQPTVPVPTSAQPTAPAYEPAPPVGIMSLEVSASVKYPITGQGGLQTVYVRVTDERGQGVGGAAVEAIVHFRSGDQVFPANSTDASGYTSLTFNIGYPPPGYTVMIEVRATYGGHTATSRTSFIPWW